MDATKENVRLKKEVNQFISRFFYNRERTNDNLALMYFLLDDLLKFVEEAQVKIGNELLDNDFNIEYIQDRNIKVYLDEELQTVLIDAMTKDERTKLVLESNKKYVEEMNDSTKSEA